MLEKSKYERSLSLFYVNACLRLDATMNGFETKFQTDFMHAIIKMKETQKPMYNVSFWFSKICWLLCTNHAIIRPNQAKLYSIEGCLMILFNSNTSPENDPAFQIICYILTLIPNRLLGRMLV